jgi:ABC-type amino acid transport substrate-binding protein
MLVTLMLLALPPALAHAQALDGTLQKIKTSGTFTIGYRESSPPFSSLGQDKRPIGYSIDLCLAVAASVQKHLGLTDLKLSWVPVTPETRVAAVVQGKVDIECGSTSVTLSRQEQVDFSLMTFVDGGSLLTTSAANLRGIGDLAGKRVAVAPGTTTEKALTEFLKKEFITAQTVPVKDHAEGLALLEAGKVEAYASDRVILIGLALSSSDPKRFAVGTSLFSYEPYAFMVRRNDAAFRLVVNRALADLYRSGRVAPIYDRWFGPLGRPGTALQAMYQLNGLPE